MNQPLKRIGADALLFTSVLFFPWWVTLCVGSLSFFLFSGYYELIAAGLLIDLLYGAPLARFGGFTQVSALGASCLFFALLVIKRRMRIEEL